MNGPAVAAGPSPFETAAVRGLLRVTVWHWPLRQQDLRNAAAKTLGSLPNLRPARRLASRANCYKLKIIFGGGACGLRGRSDAGWQTDAARWAARRLLPRRYRSRRRGGRAGGANLLSSRSRAAARGLAGLLCAAQLRSLRRLLHQLRGLWRVGGDRSRLPRALLPGADSRARIGAGAHRRTRRCKRAGCRGVAAVADHADADAVGE